MIRSPVLATSFLAGVVLCLGVLGVAYGTTGTDCNMWLTCGSTVPDPNHPGEYLCLNAIKSGCASSDCQNQCSERVCAVSPEDTGTSCACTATGSPVPADCPMCAKFNSDNTVAWVTCVDILECPENAEYCRAWTSGATSNSTCKCNATQ